MATSPWTASLSQPRFDSMDGSPHRPEFKASVDRSSGLTEKTTRKPATGRYNGLMRGLSVIQVVACLVLGPGADAGAF